MRFVVDSVTVLFRPFAVEAHNAAALLASLEGVALLALCGASVRRLVRLPRERVRRPYVAFAFVYTFALSMPSRAW